MVETHTLLISLCCLLIATAVFLIAQRGTALPFVPAIGGQSKGSNRQPTFIICGPTNSGKTTLYHWLTSGKVFPTVMSQEPNFTTHYELPSTAKGSSSSTNFKLIEFPGHAKLHSLILDEIKRSNTVHGLVFVIDATSDPAKLTEAAHFLYKVLTVSERRPGGIDVLIACNKSDLFSSRQPHKIKELLEKEIDTYRRLQGANVSKVDAEAVGVGAADEDEDEIELGSQANAFHFEQLDANVDVVAGSVLKKKTEKWECWIDERAVNF